MTCHAIYKDEIAVTLLYTSILLSWVALSVAQNNLSKERRRTAATDPMGNEKLMALGDGSPSLSRRITTPRNGAVRQRRTPWTMKN